MSTKIEYREVPLSTPMAVSGGVLTGRAIVFDQATTIGEGRYGFDEIVRREAVERALSRDGDVRSLWNHDTSWILGRTKSGTLRLKITDGGLDVEISPPDSEIGKHFREVVKRGDVDGMSFGFRVVNEKRTENGGSEGRDLREILDMHIYEVSPVTFPAYSGTSIQARNRTASVQSVCGFTLRNLELALAKRRIGPARTASVRNG